MFLFTYVKDAVLCMKVIDANNKMVPVEDLLQSLPNVRNFKYRTSSPKSYTSKTPEKIAALKRNVKFNSFVLLFPPLHILNAEAFADLIKVS
uniref:Uncharacterized protein n=1 Tax=Panagrolaimus sp. PS1159 TaxID=55785 RepID=A0AC35F0F6_9BILA